MRFVAALLLCGALAACATTAHAPPPTPPDYYLIIFQGKATAILPKAAATINRVAASANAHPDRVVRVAGPSTKSAPHYSPHLAAERMREVEHALEAAGVDKARIVHTHMTGASIKPDGTGAQQVEIRLVPKPAKARTTQGSMSSQMAGLTPH